MDFIVELPPSEECTAIFVVVDRLSKMAHFIPLNNTPSAMETARVFIKEIVRLHGVPVNIVCDQGVQFTTWFWRALCEVLKTELFLASAYHSQTNGQAERTNQTLEQYIWCFTSFAQNDWVSSLPLAELAYNNASHSTTGQSPFFVNYGFHVSFLPDFVSESSVPAVQNTMELLSHNNKILLEAVTKAQMDNKRAFDKKRRGELNLQTGDRV